LKKGGRIRRESGVDGNCACFWYLAKVAKPAKNANFLEKIPGGEPAAAPAAPAQTYKVFETL
jgi:hypothetical protein